MFESLLVGDGKTLERRLPAKIRVLIDFLVEKLEPELSRLAP